jgi:hypothetical protein
MKTIPHSVLVLLLAAGAMPLSAHPGGVSQNVSNAATLSSAASAQAIAASGELGVAAAKTVSGAAALAFWTGGSAVATTGTVVAAVGESTAKAGTTVMQGGDRLWDFASGDPAKRPALDRTRSVPPLAPVRPTTKKDPPPAEMMRTAQR